MKHSCTNDPNLQRARKGTGAERTKRAKKHHKKGVLERVERTDKYGSGEEEDEGNERYNGIVAAQQREFDLTQ